MAIESKMNGRVINHRNNVAKKIKVNTLIYRKKTLQSFKCIFPVEMFDSCAQMCSNAVAAAANTFGRT